MAATDFPTRQVLADLDRAAGAEARVAGSLDTGALARLIHDAIAGGQTAPAVAGLWTLHARALPQAPPPVRAALMNGSGI